MIVFVTTAVGVWRSTITKLEGVREAVHELGTAQKLTNQELLHIQKTQDEHQAALRELVTKSDVLSGKLQQVESICSKNQDG